MGSQMTVISLSEAYGTLAEQRGPGLNHCLDSTSVVLSRMAASAQS